MMKEFLLLVSPEQEEHIIAQLGGSDERRTVLRSANVKRIHAQMRKKVNPAALRRELGNALWALLERETFDGPPRMPKISDIQRVARDIDGSTRTIVVKLRTGTKQLEDTRQELEKARSNLIEARARLATLQALKLDELKKCLAVGVVRFRDLASLGFTSWPRLEEHLQRYSDVTYRLTDISLHEGLLLVFGPEERRAWVEALFLVFEVKDIFEVLNARDVLLALDPRKREQAMQSYEETIRVLQDFVEREVDVIKAKDELEPVLHEARLTDEILSILLNQKSPIDSAVCAIAGKASEQSTAELGEAVALLNQDKTCVLFLHVGDISSQQDT